jgi:hypothetical protein
MRQKKLASNRKIYTLNKPPREMTEDPRKAEYPNNLQNFFLFPLINLTYNQSVALSQRDGDELPWLLIYGYLQMTSLNFLKEKFSSPSFQQYNSTKDFHNLVQIVRERITVSSAKLPKSIYQNPSSSTTIHQIFPFCHYYHSLSFVITTKVANHYFHENHLRVPERKSTIVKSFFYIFDYRKTKGTKSTSDIHGWRRNGRISLAATNGRTTKCLSNKDWPH